MRLVNWTVAIALITGPALADSVSTMSRSGLFQNQTSVLDGRAAEQYSNSTRLAPPTTVVPYTGTYQGPFLDIARTAARRNGVPVDLFLRLVTQESGWDVDARSHKGAIGLAQLMPDTARRLGVNPYDPAENLDGGARYLRQQYDSFGNWPHALAAYNAGPGAVRQYSGIPPFAETTHYVQVIWGR